MYDFLISSLEELSGVSGFHQSEGNERDIARYIQCDEAKK
jgi:hypothetical protein